MNADRRLPSVFEAEPQLHASIFDEVVPLCLRADAGAPIYDERQENGCNSRDEIQNAFANVQGESATRYMYLSCQYITTPVHASCE